ncbi:hypothetical protein RFI_38295 [Reticulomyxa filosa]|uniref:Uncharacterized protein n=1 Tax=Reticulomyxa filosa TaxID=46433 RepID=X6LDH4_RETFI|nr:hypothetical protein RFI_38295 [Reticulomyxa filosa]|eukprot:ETN99186.1 hypothetical protein RFI_38295 [Reticulomyxa filosa]
MNTKKPIGGIFDQSTVRSKYPYYIEQTTLKNSSKYELKCYDIKQKQRKKEIELILGYWTRSFAICSAYLLRERFVYVVQQQNNCITTQAKYFQQLKMHRYLSCIKSVRFLPDGSKIVLSSYDKTIRILDVAAQKELRILQGHLDWVNYA